MVDVHHVEGDTLPHDCTVSADEMWVPGVTAGSPYRLVLTAFWANQMP